MKPVKRTFNNMFPAFDHLWNDFFHDDFQVAARRNQYTMPAVNVKEEDQKYVLELAAPGMDRDAFEVSLEKNVLTISAKQEEKAEQEGENGTYTRREFRYHSFSRSFTLPETVDPAGIEAKYVDGVLHVALPKRVEAQVPPARSIEIG